MFYLNVLQSEETAPQLQCAVRRESALDFFYLDVLQYGVTRDSCLDMFYLTVLQSKKQLSSCSVQSKEKGLQTSSISMCCSMESQERAVSASSRQKMYVLQSEESAQYSFAKEPYRRDYILHKRPIILRSLLIVHLLSRRCRDSWTFSSQKKSAP